MTQTRQTFRTVIRDKVSTVLPFTPNKWGDVNTQSFQIGPFVFKTVFTTKPTSTERRVIIDREESSTWR